MKRTSSLKNDEWLLGLLLLVLGVGARILFAYLFPTRPVSDFRGIIDFALDLRDKSLFVPGYYWDVFNLGPPFALSLVLRVFRGDPEAVARYTTAVWCGLMPLFPFLFWRRVLPLWVRVTGAVLLALWPGQVFFSGVVAQDNWTLVPSVALACLAVKALLDPERRSPALAMSAGLVYALAVTMRQEMLFVLVPTLVAAAGFTSRQGWRPRNVAACGLAIGLPFLALALQREKATGHFALSSGHAGFTLLGTVVPGATDIGWVDPVSFIASVEPDLARDRHRMFAEAKRLAWDEVLRRPGFQVLRAVTQAIRYPFRGETEILYWSVFAPEVLPPSHAARGVALFLWAGRSLKVELIGIYGLFLAALGLGLARRNWAILVLSMSVFLKIGLHAVLVSAGRFFLPATGIALMVGTLGLWEISRSPGWRRGWKILALGGAAALGLFLLSRPLYSRVRQLDSVEEQRTYRFLLTSWEHPGELRCQVRRGRLTALGDGAAVLETLRVDPLSGDKAVAECTLTQIGPPVPLKIEVMDGYAGGGFPGRMIQRVTVEGEKTVSHDVAAVPWTGWWASPAVELGGGASRKITVEVEALAPDGGMGWGPAAGTRFRLGGETH